jgi:hypothetical protein
MAGNAFRRGDNFLAQNGAKIKLTVIGKSIGREDEFVTWQCSKYL